MLYQFPKYFEIRFLACLEAHAEVGEPYPGVLRSKFRPGEEISKKKSRKQENSQICRNLKNF
jgi:hypothetical protein